MTTIPEKLESLKVRLLSKERKAGAILVVYQPEEELTFRSAYGELLQELGAKGIGVRLLDLSTLVFGVLKDRGLLDKAFKLDATGSRDLRQNLSGMVQRETYSRVRAAASEASDAVICLSNTAALYPWISYSALLDETENTVSNTFVIPFPGTQRGAALHFLGTKDGYNYRATRI